MPCATLMTIATQLEGKEEHALNYGERDYDFGAAMLTLRTEIGLTQAELAKHLGISRRAVGEWETGGAYPKPEHLKALIALAIQHQAFPAGHEAEEIRALWKVARQKVLLNEQWLASLLSLQRSPHLHHISNAPKYAWMEKTIVPLDFDFDFLQLYG